ncbi:AraC family transcriptional regulator [Rhizobium sp. P44RR-XXIV]|uniref:AraC family transcriptional regulator n=1 Tax=Rhizobium sp. P44RR-XXIV TaxID=1921145 RepID=UPI000984F9BB|nr:AraC family transcriptional regulator [Rhizobium sp. P44RR-XXIV]TIX86920.1 AraC family transcriptional regulator [Rhizobium sp. P44RR-XXIV]
MKQLLDTMCDVVERHAHVPRYPTVVPGLTLYQMSTSVHPIHALYNPRVCIILRGGKTVSLGEEPFYADPSTFLLVTADLPVASRVFSADDGRSHLALTMDLDRALLAEVLQCLPTRQAPVSPLAGVIAAPLERALLEPFARLLSLLDHPDEIDFLRPLIVQEIHYRLARSGLGDVLAQFAFAGSHLWQISKATSWIKANYKEPMSIEDLADLAGMSVTSFHRHFKAITLMSPFQYRTQVRLQEARRILLSERLTAGIAGVMVGYDSQSQFSRDYKRMFGAPPGSDTARLMGAV